MNQADKYELILATNRPSNHDRNLEVGKRRQGGLANFNGSCNYDELVSISFDASAGKCYLLPASVACRNPTIMCYASFELATLVLCTEVREADEGLLDREGYIAHNLAPVVGSLADEVNQLLHAIQCLDADVASIGLVVDAVGVLQILSGDVDEGCPIKVIVRAGLCGRQSGRRSSIGCAELVVLCPEVVEVPRKGTKRDPSMRATMILLTSTVSQDRYSEMLRYTGHRGCVGRASRVGHAG